MGFLMEKELKYLHEELDKPAKPFVVIMGGSKVSDKIGVLKALMQKADTILIGGAMANTFFKARGNSDRREPCRSGQDPISPRNLSISRTSAA